MHITKGGCFLVGIVLLCTQGDWDNMIRLMFSNYAERMAVRALWIVGWATGYQPNTVL